MQYLSATIGKNNTKANEENIHPANRVSLTQSPISVGKENVSQDNIQIIIINDVLYVCAGN